MAKKRKTAKQKKIEQDQVIETSIDTDEKKDIFDPPDDDGLRIEVARQQNKEGDWEYYWLLYAGNGIAVATGPEPHTRLNDLKKTIESMAENLKDAPLIRLY